MPTIPQLKINTDARIRNKVAVHSITRGEVSDTFDEVGLELLLRGLPQVAATADLVNESHLNTNLVLVPNYGVFKAYASAFTPDFVDSFYSADIGWLWIRVLQNPVITPDYTSFVRSGGERTWVTGYTFDVAPSVYQINGVPYAVPVNTQVTLAPADPLLDRIDLFVVNNLNQVVVLTGTPAENPQAPSIDPTTQIDLGFVIVKANTTQPVVPQQWIYREDAEWATVESHPTIVSNSANNPAAGLLVIEATAALPNHNIRFNAPAPVNIGVTGENVLKFRIDPKAAWGVLGSGIRIQFYNGATAVGSPVLFQNGSYGFNSSNLNYQPIVIPLNSFGALPTINAVVFTISGAVPTSLGFYLDEIELQGADIPANGGRFFEDGGNGWGHTAVLGTKDNHNLSIILNNVQRGQFRTDDVFEYRGNVHLYGSNPGISLFTGTFAASDYYFKRTGTSTIVHSAGIVDLQVGQKSGYTVNSNSLRGHEWYDMASPTNTVQMQLLPSGVLSLKKYGVGTQIAAPAYGLGVSAAGNLVEYVLGGGGGGSVTSVGLGNITNFATATSDTTNPITAAGTLGYNLNSQNANLVFAGPAAGGAATPTFRSLVAADLGNLITATNGLRMASSTNVQLGGAGSELLGNTTIPTSAFSLTINSSNANQTLRINNSVGGAGLWATSTTGSAVYGQGGAYGVAGYSASGIAVQAFSDNGLPLEVVRNTTITNTVVRTVNVIAQTTTTPVNNFGASIDIEMQTNGGTAISNQIISKWTTIAHASRVSEYSITGVDNAITSTLFTLSGNGRTRLHKYGVNTFSGSPAYALGVDANGNIVEFTPGGGGGTVLSVSGTLNRITSTGGANPVINIDPNYVGQTSITTLGTVTAGTWSATTISTDRGGTGQTSYLNGEILIGNTTGNTLVKSTISPGIGINIVNGPGSVTVHSMFNHAVQTGATTSALYTWNVTNGENLRWSITGLNNSLAITNPVAGRYYTVEIIQAVGGATVSTYPSGTIWFGGIAPTLSLVTGEVDCVVFYYNGINFLAQPNALAGSITPLAGGGTGSNLADPNADRILFWDDSAGQVTWLTVGTNLSITGTTINASGGGSTYTASGGLSESPAGNFVLGGTALSADTTIPTSAFKLTINSSNTSRTLEVFNTGTGFPRAIYGESTNGVGIYARTTASNSTALVGEALSGSSFGVSGGASGGRGVTGSATTGVALYGDISGTGYSGYFYKTNSTTNTSENIVRLQRATSGTAANGIGQVLDFMTQVSDGSQHVSNGIVSKWTDVTVGTRTSEFSITGVNNGGSTGTILTIAGNGALTLGASYQGLGAGFLAVSNTGAVTWSAGSGGGGGDALTSNPLSQFAATTSAQLAGVISDETGTGALVFANSPTLITPALGTPSSIVLTNGTGLPISTGVSGLGANVATWLATPSSANLASAVTDETGTGALVFATTPTITTPVISGAMSTTAISQHITTASGEGTVPSIMFVRLTSDASMSDVNTAQSPFGSSFDVWTVQANTTYWFEGLYILTHGAVSHSVSLLFTLSTATVSLIAYDTICWVTDIGTNTASQTTNVINVTTATAVNAAGANANETIVLRGFISIGTGGTIRPDVQFSTAPGGTPLCRAGSYFKMYPVGADTIQSLGAVA